MTIATPVPINLFMYYTNGFPRTGVAPGTEVIRYYVSMSDGSEYNTPFMGQIIIPNNLPLSFLNLVQPASYWTGSLYLTRELVASDVLFMNVRFAASFNGALAQGVLFPWFVMP